MAQTVQREGRGKRRTCRGICRFLPLLKQLCLAFLFLAHGARSFPALFWKNILETLEPSCWLEGKVKQASAEKQKATVLAPHNI